MNKVLSAFAVSMLFPATVFAQLTPGTAVENKHELQPVLSSLVAGGLPMMSFTESQYGGHAIFRLSTKDYRRGLCKIDVLKVDFSSPNSPSEALGAHDPRNGVTLGVKSIVAESYFISQRRSPRTVRCEYVGDTESFFRASDVSDAQYAIAGIKMLQNRLIRNPELLDIQCLAGFDCEALIRDFKFKNGVYASRSLNSEAFKINISYRTKGTRREQRTSSYVMVFDDVGEASKKRVQVRFLPIRLPPD